MTSTHRFDCASSSLILKTLLRKTQRIFWICFGLGIIAHTSLTQIGGFEAEQKSVKPLTTQFVKRQPRLTKPLELKKRAQPKRRPIQRKMLSVKARMQRGQRGARFQPMQVLRGLARPSVEIGRGAAFASIEVEPTSVAEIIEGTKEVEQKIDMALELLDIDALNTGEHHAMVIQDPEDKRNIRGFLHLVAAYSTHMQGYYYEVVIRTRLIAALHRLVEALNRYTGIKADMGGKYTFDSAEILKAPWILVSTAGPFRMTDQEARNFARYLMEGGLAFLDGNYSGGAAPATVEARVPKNMLQRALSAVGLVLGQHWDYEILPSSHPVYHCYFDFEGPPAGSNDILYPHLPPGSAFLEAVQYSGRAIALISDKNLRSAWSDWATGWGTPQLDNTRQLQFGVNLIVFALTQEGSITHRLMDSIR